MRKKIKNINFTDNFANILKIIFKRLSVIGLALMLFFYILALNQKIKVFQKHHKLVAYKQHSKCEFDNCETHNNNRKSNDFSKSNQAESDFLLNNKASKSQEKILVDNYQSIKCLNIFFLFK
jgi:hypothetical protein